MLGVGSELTISGESDLVQAIRESAQSNTARAGDQITQRNLDIQPTITIRPGAPVRVLVTRTSRLRAERRADMVDLKLGKLPDRTPVKFSITITPDLQAALQAYAAAYGVEEPVAELIPAMLGRLSRKRSWLLQGSQRDREAAMRATDGSHLDRGAHNRSQPVPDLRAHSGGRSRDDQSRPRDAGAVSKLEVADRE